MKKGFDLDLGLFYAGLLRKPTFKVLVLNLILGFGTRKFDTVLKRQISRVRLLI